MDADYIWISNLCTDNYMHYQYLISILMSVIQHAAPFRQQGSAEFLDNV